MLEAQAEAVNEGLLLVAPDGQIISYNRRFAEQWGFTDELMDKLSDDAALATAVNQLVDPEAFLARVRYLYEQPDELSNDELQFKDGRVLERYSAPVRGQDGTYYGRVWSFRDISEERRVERSLAQRADEQAALYRFTDQLHRARANQDVYEAAIEAIVTALACDRASLLLFDESDFMSFVAWRGLSDRYRHAVNGHTPWRPDDIDAEPITVASIIESDLDEGLKQTVLTEGIGAFAFIPLVSARRLIGKFMVYYDSPHQFDEDEVSLALTVARQIAFGIERRRAEEERIRAEEALREADRRKDEFLATLAHELRNPLAPIHNALPIMKRKLAAGDEVTHLVDIMERQTSRLGRLVDELLDVSRITRGHVELRREVTDLLPLVGSALEAVKEAADADGLQFDFGHARGPVPVVGDPMRLEQVIQNLLANAVKYTEAGGRITVRVSAINDAAEVRISDTGMGIDPAFLGQVFDLFQQADRSLDRARGGLGIGLTVARQLVELHGGTIEAHSDGLGTGSEFVVRLPLVNEEPALAEPPRPSTTRSPSHRRVLVVDDNRDQTEVLAELIGQMGHEVYVAHEGSDAIRLTAEVRPDVILLDLGLPGMSGYEVAEHLRRESANRSVRLIALTGYSQPSERERSRTAGFDVHIVKPIDTEELMQLLDGANTPGNADI